MSALTIELPAQENQTEFTVLRWTEMVSDTPLGRELARIEGRIETDRHGHIVLLPPADFVHGRCQAEIAFHSR